MPYVPATFPVTPERHLIGVIAGLSRSREPDDPELVEARRKLACLRALRVIEKSPPFTVAEREQIVAVLRAGEVALEPVPTP